MTTNQDILIIPDGPYGYLEVIVEGNKLSPVSDGSRFVAFLDSRRVFKLDQRRRNLEQTKHEIKLLRKIKGGDKKYFPRLLAHGKLTIEGVVVYWLIETRINVEVACRYSNGVSDAALQKLETLEEKYSLRDVSNNCHNYGWTKNGQPRILDAGYGDELEWT